MNTLGRIQSWYLSQCDGDWEHRFGLTVGTLDNPGWMVDIDLHHTNLEEMSFSPIEYGIVAQSLEDEGNWLSCRVENKVFKGRGGPEKLQEILDRFLDWTEDV